ncbi:MAG: Hsp20/alpha crystallin family protein [Crenarchaeota archaeon]|nr:Hsp20/alpha crystallin family protein [Thermoproteota archaeon]
MSARWRRSKKQQRWVDIKNTKITIATKTHSPKIIKAEKIKPINAKKIQLPKKYHLPKKLGKSQLKAPKPLIDMFHDSKSITIIADIAGFSQESMKISVKSKKLTLSAKTKDGKYYKSLNLPKVVIPSIAHTTFKNGVLTIRLKKAVKKEIIKEEAGLNDAS